MQHNTYFRAENFTVNTLCFILLLNTDSFFFFTQLNSDSVTDDAISNHLDSLQQSQESSSSVLTEEPMPTPLLPRPDSPTPETALSDSNSSQLPEVGSIRSLNKLCTGAI